VAKQFYIHTDVFAAQTSKRPGQPCGDQWGVYRDRQATTIILSDGLGSGIKAHIAATMCVARIKAMLEAGSSLREAFNALTRTMDKAWGTAEPFAVFTVARILNNGQTTVLSYEMPPPIFINRVSVQLLNKHVYTRNKAIITESVCSIGKDEGLLIMSDGITQAGIGKLFPMGWESDGVKRFLQAKLPLKKLDGEMLAIDVHAQARAYWPAGTGDDCTVVAMVNRRGIIVNWLSGPPINKADDENWVKTFLNTPGIHVVSGGTTANLVSRITGNPLQVIDTYSAITPPAYELPDIEMVTEGVVTLNQVFNLLDEDPDAYPENSPVSDLAWQLRMADRINLWQGMAENKGESFIAFKQQGLMSRSKVLTAISERLRQMGKLVVCQNC